MVLSCPLSTKEEHGTGAPARSVEGIGMCVSVVVVGERRDECFASIVPRPLARS